MSEIYGTYKFKHFANRGKIEKIKEVLKEYRKTAQNIANYLWMEFFKSGGNLPHKKKISVKHIPSNLSERYKYVCLWQVYGVLQSYISNLQRQFANIVWNSTLSREDKLVLLAINQRQEWLKCSADKVNIYDNRKPKEVEVKDFHRMLAKKIFKHLMDKNRKPSFKNISMHLDGKVVELLPKQQGKAKSFDYWLKISTLEKRNPIYIPLKKNSYAESLEGKFLNFCQVVERGENLEFRILKELRKREYVPTTDVIAIDLGLNPLFADNKGDLIGRSFLSFLTKLDEKITKRMASLQRRGLKPSEDKKYVKLITKLREFLKNEINRMLNRIVEIYKPAKIVVEKLDFRSPELSKRMNRLVQNFGKRFVKEKLERLRELYGIEVVEVNPGYSSQECSFCGYVDSRNRKDTHTFECKVCGKKINAQVNASRNLLRRSSLKEFFFADLPKKKVLKILVKKYLERLKGCWSAPLELLKSNPYFRDYLEEFLNPRQGSPSRVSVHGTFVHAEGNSVHEVSNILKNKGVPIDYECVIVEVCSPKHASQVLSKNAFISTAMPCRIAIFQRDNKTVVSTIAPTAMLDMYDEPELKPVAEEVEKLMKEIMEESL